jgi:hypothetical protein
VGTVIYDRIKSRLPALASFPASVTVIDTVWARFLAGGPPWTGPAGGRTVLIIRYNVLLRGAGEALDLDR